MKKNFVTYIFMTLVVMFIAGVSIASAQGFTVKETKSEFKFDVNNYDNVVGTIEVEDKSFDLYETDSGATFVKAMSKKGNLYPVWIGVPSELKYEGKTVYYFTKSGNYCYYKLSSTGYPWAVWLDKNE